MRADAVAWAACSLLYVGRKRTICHDEIVTGFRQRYQLWQSVASPDQLAEPHSPAEAELFQLLDLISDSAPLHAVVCFEAFEHNANQSTYAPILYGCASPNINAAAIVGNHATALFPLLKDKSWLTVDRLDILALPFYLRQNCITEVVVAAHDTSIEMITHKTRTNYSSAGGLFTIMVMIDLALIAMEINSNCEIAQLMISPMFDISDQAKHKDLKTFFACSLFRSRPVALLTMTSQLIAWILVIPNAMVWTWTEESSGKVQAFLCTLRIWVLVLLLINQLWDSFVMVAEDTAYKVVKKTYLTSLELVVITMAVVYGVRERLYSISEFKYAADHQRHADNTTFDRWVAFGNAFDPESDYVSNSTWPIVYKPLAIILAYALVASFGWAAVRWLFYHHSRPSHQQPSRTISPTSIPIESKHGPKQLPLSRIPGNTVCPRPPEQPGPHLTTGTQYVRLPIEEHLGIPMRARSLVRDSIALEAMIKDNVYLLPTEYLSHGVVVEDGRFLRTRRGFPAVLPHRIEVGGSEDGRARVLDATSFPETPLAPRKLTTSRRRSSFHPPLR